ncbi:hypothetical protein HYR54_17100 [Candidatus Acetothermia bacterium]|nr:hypothetical protein [Candidatus Acetothermia bacterium]MBI3461276.1 hypothetical protein [Candidatus Acetothermia bacterium]MBI3660574.1 hypothetical protein [Candidatus Acetothermia bacterium]
MRTFFNAVTITLLIACVNILSFSITCYSPMYGSDGHEHTFFHLFETHSDDHSETHSDAHSKTDSDADTNSHHCSLDSHSSMAIMLSAMSCDLCIGQASLAIHAHPISEKILSDHTLSVARDFLHPPTEPPELS